MGRYKAIVAREERAPKIEHEGRVYLSSRYYCEKYSIGQKKIAPACNAGALVSVRRRVYKDKEKPVVWYVLDVPPEQHPNWEAHVKRLMSHGSAASTRDLPKKALEYLQMFDAARASISHTNFSQGELAQMIGVHKSTIWRWTEVGEEGFGKLPRIKFSSDKQERLRGGQEMYYATKDIRRFLLGELRDPTKKFKTIDDLTAKTTQDEMAAKHGYFVYDPEKVYPVSYEGFVKWATQNVMREDKKLGKWVPFVPIQMQLDFYRNVWETNEDGTLKHRFIRICRPRGDFKSFDCILIFLFRFFNMQREKILLSSNSKDQSDYALYDEARDIILNSPKLMDTLGLEVKEKEIVLMAGRTERYSRIKSIASKTGTLSNATCVVFSEIYKLADHSFIVELEGSIRGVINGMSIIESTVSREGTYYHRQYEKSLEGKSPLMYFQYYCDIHYNPNMTEEELAQYKESFFPEEYKMFFRNRWGDAGDGLFSDITILMMGLAGFDGVYGPSQIMREALREYLRAKHKVDQLLGKGDILPHQKVMQEIESKMIHMDSLYSLPASPEDAERIKEVFKCSDLFIGIGIDRAEQLTPDADRTAMVTTAKAFITDDIWYAFLLDLYMPPQSSAGLLQNRIIENNERFGYLSRIDIEKAQGKDLVDWCELHGLPGYFASASYEYQKEIFRRMYTLAVTGYLKAPTVPMWVNEEGVLIYSMPPAGIKDVLRMEMSAFEHMITRIDKKTGWFGSKFKKASKTGRPRKGQARDDSIYGWAHSLAGCNAGDTPSDVMAGNYSKANINKDVIGDWAQ